MLHEEEEEQEAKAHVEVTRRRVSIASIARPAD